MTIDWAWIADHLGAIVGRTFQHIYLAAIPIAVGFAISFALALWSVRQRTLYPPISAVAGVLYTIPSLALFAALVPITGLSILTAVVPLILYTLLIFLRNIVAGFDAVPADVREAAAGMGFTRNQQLWQVELPLARPLIIAGVRLATVSTIGLVTISGTLGDRFGGLGFFIFEGYRRGFPTEIYAGAIPSIALAIAADIALVRLQRRLTPWAAAPRSAARATDR
jgi:osmoprotectant transport system permease protein